MWGPIFNNYKYKNSIVRFWKKGKFVFNGALGEPHIVHISIEGFSRYKKFYVENSDICFIAQKDSIEKSQIIGCRLEDEKEEYESLIKIKSIEEDEYSFNQYKTK